MMTNEQTHKIYILAQHTTSAGRRAYPHDSEDSPETSDDYALYEGTDDEIRAEIASLIGRLAESDAAPYESSLRIGAGTDLFLQKVARTLAEAIDARDPFAEDEDAEDEDAF